MKQFIQNVFTKIKNYFTANLGRKIFFYGLILSLVSIVLYLIIRVAMMRILITLSFVVAGFGTLWDSMYTRYLFLKKIREIQFNHLSDLHSRQEAGEDVVITATFSPEEKKYLRRRKWGFVFIILFKVVLLIALFSLLLRM